MFCALIAASVIQDNTAPTLSLAIPKETVKAHSKLKAVLSVTFAEGLHGYQNPPSPPDNLPVSISLGKGDAKLLTVEYPKGVEMKTAGTSARVYQGTIKIPFVIKVGSKTGPITVKFDYQQCTDAACFPPGSVTASGIVHIKK